MIDLPFISADQTFAVWAAIMFIAAFGFWADETRLGRNVSGVALILVAGMVLSNFGILPKVAPVYGVIWEYLVPISVALLLLNVDIRKVFAETGGLLWAFAFGAVGTTIGALIGYMVLPLGDSAPELAGVFSATYIGGSMNMAAVTQAVNLDPSLVTAAVAADNVVGVLYLAFLAVAPSLLFFRKLYQYKAKTVSYEVTAKSSDNTMEAPTIDLKQLGLALGLAFTLSALGKWSAVFLGIDGYGIMFVTAYTVIVANLFPAQLARLRGQYHLGMFFMYLFFAVIGVGADVIAMLDNALILASYAVLIVLCHAAFVFFGSRITRLDLIEVVIASNACASGPASAAALAGARGRQDLVAPAVLVGVFGYAIANLIGISITGWLGY